MSPSPPASAAARESTRRATRCSRSQTAECSAAESPTFWGNLQRRRPLRNTVARVMNSFRRPRNLRIGRARLNPSASVGPQNYARTCACACIIINVPACWHRRHCTAHGAPIAVRAETDSVRTPNGTRVRWRLDDEASVTVVVGNQVANNIESCDAVERERAISDSLTQSPYRRRTGMRSMFNDIVIYIY